MSPACIFGAGLGIMVVADGALESSAAHCHLSLMDSRGYRARGTGAQRRGGPQNDGGSRVVTGTQQHGQGGHGNGAGRPGVRNTAYDVLSTGQT